MTPEVLRILTALRRPPEPTVAAPIAASPKPPPKAASLPPVEPPEETLLDPTRDILVVECPRGLDAAVFTEVLLLRARRTQLQRLIQTLECAVEPVRNRLRCFSSLDRLNDYSRRAAELSLKATRQQEVDCAALKEKEDRDWVRAKEDAVAAAKRAEDERLNGPPAEESRAPSEDKDGADSDSSKK